MAMSIMGIYPLSGAWRNVEKIEAKTYNCGFCGAMVSSKDGYVAMSGRTPSEYQTAVIRICPGCNWPTVFDGSARPFPGSAPGNTVAKVPDELSKLYNEARLSAAAGAYTAAVLVCRKILMHLAVEEGAKEGQSFLGYVEYLADKGYVPPNGKVWVDYIRQKGNEANHEIKLMNEEDAGALIIFAEMLLRFIYEFPNKVPAKPLPPSGGGAPLGGSDTPPRIR